MNDLDQYLEFAKELAKEAGEIMRQYFDIGIDKTWKEDNTPLTVADTTINDLVIERVKTRFPDHGILGEEASYESKRNSIWVVDPIDGTIPFTVGIPVSTFCLAFVEDGEPKMSVVYEPVQDRLFWATKNEGVFMNGKKIKVSASKSLAQNFLTMPARNMKNHKDIGQLYEKIAELKGIPFNLWSFAYCGMCVATGQMVGAIFGGESPWDGAAVKLIVEEAGGKTSDANGKTQLYNDKINGMVVSNGLVHDQLIELLKK